LGDDWSFLNRSDWNIVCSEKRSFGLVLFQSWKNGSFNLRLGFRDIGNYLGLDIFLKLSSYMNRQVLYRKLFRLIDSDSCMSLDDIPNAHQILTL
jgi:hypothetical protein